MVSLERAVRLGYAVPSGDEVVIPIKHLAVTGQTQEAGKTTTLEALLTRATVRAVTFITKRGEGTFGRAGRIGPYFREQADWRFVSSLLEAFLGERLKFERSWIMRAAKGARTLADVREHITRLQKTAKGLSADVYMVLGEYLDELVPAIAAVRWASRVELREGINVMDLTLMPTSLQHLVIKSALDWILEHATDTIVVVPEAWKFIPQGRGTPVKLAAAAYIRQGAALRNYLWLDSQDLGGVEKEILRSVPVWLLGVQREANEIKRTLTNIPATIARPKPGDIATLEVGEFIACWGKHAVRTYVQPAWIGGDVAMQVARGHVTRRAVAELQPAPFHKGTLAEVAGLEPVGDIAKRVVASQQQTHQAIDQLEAFVTRGRRAQAAVDQVTTFGTLAVGELFWWTGVRGPEPMRKTSATQYAWSRGHGTAEAHYAVVRVDPDTPTKGEEMNPAQEKKLDALVGSVDKLTGQVGAMIGRMVDVVEAVGGRGADGPVPRNASKVDASGPVFENLDAGGIPVSVEPLYQQFKARLLAELPTDPRVMAIVVAQPELRVKVKREVIEVDGRSLRGLIARLILDNFFDDPKSPGNVQSALRSGGHAAPAPNVVKELEELARMGFVVMRTGQGKGAKTWYQAVEGMKRHVVEESRG